MCDSMPTLDVDFNFNDINLDFLETSHHQKPAIITPQVQNCNKPGQPAQLKIVKSKDSVQDLSKRIAEVDSLVCHSHNMERERNDLRKQLEELQQSTKEVQNLYANEKRKRIEEESKNRELLQQNQSLDTHLTAKTLEVDQLQAQLDNLKVPIKYDELVVRYLKLVQKFDEDHALHWQELAVVRDLQKYCKEHCLKVPAITQRSPRKRKTSAAKVDAEIQCDIGAVESLTTARKKSREQSTQYTNVKTRNQGSQHIGTTTTRSTTTSCFFKYHDVGVNCNLLDFKDVFHEMLDDMRSWSTHVSPLSPIADLDRSSDKSMSINSPPKQLSPAYPKLSTPPPPSPSLPIELKTVGTCTYICNVQRNIDYIAQLPTIKRSNSRPPSSLFFDTVKDEINARSTTMNSSTLNSLNNSLPSIPNLFPTAFDELWQIFGHMLYGLLQRRVGNGVPSSNQNSITNQHEFYNWLQTLYLDINTEEPSQIQQPHTQGTRSEENVEINSNREGTTTENILDQQTQHCSVGSPLNFSNEAPVKCTSSRQYLFKPKAQRSGNHKIDELAEESTSNCIESQSVGTSPIRCIISSPNFSETNQMKANYIDHSNKKSNADSSENVIENRTPSAFSSPKSNNMEPTETKNMLKLLNTSKLQSIERKIHKNLKEHSKKIIKKRKGKRRSTTWSKIENETAVDFLANLNVFNDKSNDSKDAENLSHQMKEHTKQNQKIIRANSSNKNEIPTIALETRKEENPLRNLNRSLFGSDTDDEDSDDENINSDRSVTLDDINNAEESSEATEIDDTDSCYNLSGIKVSYSNPTIYSDDNMNLSLSSSDNDDMKLSQFSSKSLKNKKRFCNRLKNSENQQKNVSKVSIYSKEKLYIRQIHSDSSKDISDKDEKASKKNDCEIPKTKKEQTLENASENTKKCELINQSTTCEIANDDQIPKDVSLKECSNKELEDENEKNVENLSPSSNVSSSSSSEPRLAIITDSDELAEFESTLLIPKKRGRKRKSESSSPPDITNTESTPFKRSARLLAKHKLNEEQKSQRKNLPLLTLPKHRSCIKKEAIEYKKEMKTQNEVLESLNVEIPVSECFREKNNEAIVIVKNKTLDKCKDFLEEKNEAIEDKDRTDLNAADSFYGNSSNIFTKNTSSKHLDDNQVSFTSSSSSPASPTPLNDICNNDHFINEIPLERSYRNLAKCNKTLLPNLISSYDSHHYRPYNTLQLQDCEEVRNSQLETLFKQHAALNTQSDEAVLLLVRQVLNATQSNPKIIAHALCSCIQQLPRSATTPYDNSTNVVTNRPPPSINYQIMTHVMCQLIQRLPELTQTLLTVIESLLFSIQSVDNVSLDAALNLTDLYTHTLTLEMKPQNENPARLFIAKCLYFYKTKAVPMIYIVLCVFPTTLPHREERNYDRSDALITVIQHTLMCTTYNMENHNLFHREMLSTLRYVYHFETYKPDFHDVLQNLIEKLRAGKLKNLKYAFALFCKRLHPERVIRDIIQTHLIPLSNEYYSRLQQTMEYDERTAALLDCFSSVIKPFPRGENSVLAAEINNSLNIFKRFLSVVDRSIIQEAAVHAILRLQRFSIINCYNALASFQPEYDLQPRTRAALKTFIYRKPYNFWKTQIG